MPRMKMKSHARQLRLELAAKRGEPLSIRQVAREMGVDYRRIAKLENGDFDDPPMELAEQVAAFYHQQGINARNIIELEFDPDGRITPVSVATPIGA